MGDIQKVSELIPVELLRPTITEESYHLALMRFLRVFGVLGVFFVFSTFSTVVLYTFFGLLWAFLPFLMGATAFLGLFFVWDSYQRSRLDLEQQRNMQLVVYNRVSTYIQNITINNVTAGKGSTVAIGATVPSEVGPSTATVIPAINATYELALNIAKVGLNAWAQNGGRRPTPKPISAEVITAHYHVGRESWQEAIQLLGDANVIAHPERANWTPVVPNLDVARVTLDNYLKRQGYFVSRSNGKEVWLR